MTSRPVAGFRRRIASAAWLWQSMKPGAMVMPFASKTSMPWPPGLVMSPADPTALKRLAARRTLPRGAQVHRADLRVDHDEIRIRSARGSGLSRFRLRAGGELRRTGHGRERGPNDSDERSTVVAPLRDR
jgi:hypothetical protein